MLEDFDVMRPRRRLTGWRVIWYLVLAAGALVLLLGVYIGWQIGFEHY